MNKKLFLLLLSIFTLTTLKAADSESRELQELAVATKLRHSTYSSFSSRPPTRACQVTLKTNTEKAQENLEALIDQGILTQEEADEQRLALQQFQRPQNQQVTHNYTRDLEPVSDNDNWGSRENSEEQGLSGDESHELSEGDALIKKLEKINREFNQLTANFKQSFQSLEQYCGYYINQYNLLTQQEQIFKTQKQKAKNGGSLVLNIEILNKELAKFTKNLEIFRTQITSWLKLQLDNKMNRGQRFTSTEAYAYNIILDQI